MTMIILQKCFRIRYQTENKQLTGSSSFYLSVCLQCSLPACLSPSLPHMCISPAREAAVPLHTSLAHRGRQSTTARDAKSHTCAQDENRNSSHCLPPSSQVSPSQKRMNTLSARGRACLPSNVSGLRQDGAAAEGRETSSSSKYWGL